MSAGKGSRPRPVHGETYRSNHDLIFQNRDPLARLDDSERPESNPSMGRVIDGKEYLGGNCWMSTNKTERSLRIDE
jgi:hypothetical protein